MAFDYSEFVATSRDLIEEFGREVQFVELATAPANPARPYLGSASPRGTPAQTLALTAVFVEPSSLNELGNQAVSEDFLKRATQIALVYSATDLASFDEILDEDGSVWQIEGLSKLKPGSTTLLYFVSVKR